MTSRNVPMERIKNLSFRAKDELFLWNKNEGYQNYFNISGILNAVRDLRILAVKNGPFNPRKWEIKTKQSLLCTLSSFA